VAVAEVTMLVLGAEPVVIELVLLMFQQPQQEEEHILLLLEQVEQEVLILPDPTAIIRVHLV
jgi:hypothetical protein